MEKSRFAKRVRAQLEEWDARLDEIKEDAVESTADMKAYYDARILDLKHKREILRARLSQLIEATDDAWEDFKEGVENAWEELSQAFDDHDREDRNKRGR